LLIARAIAAHAIAVSVPIVIAAGVFASAVGHVKANNRFDVEALGMSAFRASDAFKTLVLVMTEISFAL
jgi:hypothetical protein